MHYVGVDLHKETSWFHVLDNKGNKVYSKSIANDEKSLKNFLSKIPKPFTLAVESTYNWYFFIDIVELFTKNVFLANSYELKAFAKRHKKTDKIDAKLIATILYKGFLPTVYIPNKNIRMIRELLRYRLGVVSDRSRNIFKLKALLDKLGFNSTGDFTTQKRLAEISSYNMPDIYKNIAINYIDKINFLSKKLYTIKIDMLKLPIINEDIIHLESIPGVARFSALLIQTEIGDINRFKSFNRLCAYAGLAPRVSASANKIFHGSLNVNRRKYLQWILLEDAYTFIKNVPKIKKRFELLKKRKGHNTAKVIIARELLKIIYHVLKEKRPFYITSSCKKAA